MNKDETTAPMSWMEAEDKNTPLWQACIRAAKTNLATLQYMRAHPRAQPIGAGGYGYHPKTEECGFAASIYNEVAAVAMPAKADGDLRRDEFEERVFAARFKASIVNTGRPTPVTFISKDCPTKAELCRRKRHPDPVKAAVGIEDYADDAVSAMWFGWCLALGRVQ